ncbi:unnamed protein product [Periconia digitata]|uniref:Uncharacterized protein n=1 Tax=Periconia digitata TaxID=1303443 RepID=A0A9W4UNF8_9PLEO|nr:unnamed protein product [Periconia digitata]
MSQDQAAYIAKADLFRRHKNDHILKLNEALENQVQEAITLRNCMMDQWKSQPTPGNARKLDIANTNLQHFRICNTPCQEPRELLTPRRYLRELMDNQLYYAHLEPDAQFKLWKKAYDNDKNITTNMMWVAKDAIDIPATMNSAGEVLRVYFATYAYLVSMAYNNKKDEILLTNVMREKGYPAHIVKLQTRQKFCDIVYPGLANCNAKYCGGTEGLDLLRVPVSPVIPVSASLRPPAKEVLRQGGISLPDWNIN